MKAFKSLAFAGCPMYEVSRHGDVRNIKTKRLIKPSDDRGYFKIRLVSTDGKYKTFRVHRLVAMAFIPNPDNLPEVNHIDECKTNNDVSNLEWCTGRYNLEHSKINKPVCKYDIEGKLLCRYWTISQAALCGGFSTHSLSSYLNGKRKKLTFHGFVYCFEGVTPVLPPKEEPKVVKTVTPLTPEEKRERERKKAHEYYLANRDKCIERKNKWREENPEKYRKQLDDYKERRSYLGKQYRARPDVIERKKETDRLYYLANKEQLLEKKRQYRQDNKERISEQQRKYRQANEERIKEKNREYRQANKEQIKEYRQEYLIANKERIKKQRHEYYLRKKLEQAQQKPTLN